MKQFVIGLIVVAVDQIVKLIIRANMTTGQTISVIGDFFTITYIKNSGAAFSVFSGQRLLLTIIPIVLIICCIAYLVIKKNVNKILSFALVMMISGGIGNLIDRIAFGSVTDMFKFSIFSPIFNMADIAVTFGCVILSIYILFEEKITGKNE